MSKVNGAGSSGRGRGGGSASGRDGAGAAAGAGGPGGGDGGSSSDDEPQQRRPRLDPKKRQDPRERREIRRMYSQIRERTLAKRHDMVQPGSEDLAETLKETNTLFHRVTEPREAAMDSQVIAMISQLAKQKAQGLHTDFCVFEPMEFAKKLITLIGGHELPDEERQIARLSRDGWIKLGEASQPFFKRSPPFHCMLGTFERGPPKKKAPGSRQARKPETVSEKGPTQPKELSSFKDSEKQEVTTVEVERMLGLLQKEYRSRGGKPMCYFELVVNPHSFGLTVENMFYCSFLVRDGYARIYLDPEKLPVIEPIEKKETTDLGRLPPRQQVVMTLTKQEFHPTPKPGPSKRPKNK